MDTPTLLVVLGVVVVILAVGGFLLWRRRGGEDETFYHFRCPKCRRRLRFHARQVGHKGQCSNCGRDVIFPPVSQAID